MERSGKTAVVTFKGSNISHQVTYFYTLYRVAPYRPGAIICHKCHRIEHKMDACPEDSRWLERYGCLHPNLTMPKLWGDHAATDAKCHKKVKAAKQMGTEKELKPKKVGSKRTPSHTLGNKQPQRAWPKHPRHQGEQHTENGNATPPAEVGNFHATPFGTIRLIKAF